MALDEVIARRYYSYSDADRPAALTSLYGAVGGGRSQLISEDPFKARQLHRLMAASPDERVQRQANAYSLELLRYDQTNPDSHPFATVLHNLLPQPEPAGEYWGRVRIGFDLSALDSGDIGLLDDIIENSFKYYDDQGQSFLESLGDEVEEGFKRFVENDLANAQEIIYEMATSDNPIYYRFAARRLVYLLGKMKEVGSDADIRIASEHMLQLSRREREKRLDVFTEVQPSVWDALGDGLLSADIAEQLDEYGEF
ncbi:hypothetical protein [Nocardia fluminea]|uniref:hypothetical protein n=1 Tax=Nocardia fluminea TaxID=134984 RepID=UPI00365B1BA8